MKISSFFFEDLCDDLCPECNSEMYNGICVNEHFHPIEKNDPKDVDGNYAHWSESIPGEIREAILLFHG